VLDARNQEHYLNWANIVEVHFFLDREQLKATIVTMAPAIGRGGDLRLHEIVVVGDQALALRAELRRRMQLADEDAPNPPTLNLAQPPRPGMPFQE
jgi:hypothetical protein